MPRVLRSLFAVSLLFIAATVPALAQAPVTGGAQTVTGAGYSYQVPSDWQQVPSSLTERMAGQVFNVDGEAVSADGNQRTHVESASGFGITSASLSDVLTSFFSTPPGAPAGSVPALNVFVGPSATQVPGADGAQAGAATYSDPDGNPRVIAATVAVRGQTAYLLTVDAKQDFYADPRFGQIMNSLRLTGAAGS